MKKYPYAPFILSEPLLDGSATTKLKAEARMALLGKDSKVFWPPFYLLAMQRADEAEAQIGQAQDNCREAINLAREENARAKADVVETQQKYTAQCAELRDLRRKYNTLLEGKNERARAIADLTETNVGLKEDLEQRAAETARLRAQMEEVLRTARIPEALLCTQHSDVVRIKHPEDRSYLAIKQGDLHLSIEVGDSKNTACFLPVSLNAARCLHRHLEACIDNWPKD